MPASVKKWPSLKHPPIILAVFQIRFGKDGIDLSRIDSVEKSIQKTLSKKIVNHHSDINVISPPPLGISQMNAKARTSISGYTFFTEDQKQKLLVECNKFTYIDEREYQGWESFTKDVLTFVHICQELFEQKIIQSISIRFINRFLFTSFNTPTEYFKTLVSMTNDSNFAFPVSNYGFRIRFDIPEDSIHSFVNQQLENAPNGKYYFFDIDVIKETSLFFDEGFILPIMEELRTIKNQIFFENITPKTIELCN